MARCAIGGRASAVCTAVRGPNVYATAAVKPRVREIGVFNTTTTAFPVAVVRATATGTKGASITAVCEDDDTHTIVTTGANTHTADATVGTPIRQATVGAAAGAGVIWTWSDFGFVLDNATTSGAVLILPTGTGQIFDFYFVWDE